MEYKRFIPLFAFVIFCIAVYRLYYALSAYERAKIVQAIFAIPSARLGLSAFFVAASYLSLALFDTLGIRYIGAKLPYRRIALASFTALSIGHTIGLAAASSGAVRYRFYSHWGIGAADIAKIILFCAMTVGLGLNTPIEKWTLSTFRQRAKIKSESTRGDSSLPTGSGVTPAPSVPMQELIGLFRPPAAGFVIGKICWFRFIPSLDDRVD